ncbi:MAG: initiation factor 2B [Desulfurococcaceae archaeon]
MQGLLEHGFAKRPTGSEYAFNVLESLKASCSGDEAAIRRALLDAHRKILLERPAAAAALNLVRKVAEHLVEQGREGMCEFIAKLEKDYDESIWKAAEVASKRIEDGDYIMTNSNSLTLRRLFRLLVESGVKFKVHVLESRPGMEGLALCEYLNELGVETYLSVDSSARFFMKNVDKVVVGVEALAVNGAVISKVGTSQLALAAHEARVRVMAIAPTMKLYNETVYGELVRLPEGDWRLLMSESVKASLPERYVARAPIYDVTPPQYIDAIATELGIVAPQAIPFVYKQVMGTYPPKIVPIEELLGVKG